jgi:hypothetical protein
MKYSLNTLITLNEKKDYWKICFHIFIINLKIKLKRHLKIIYNDKKFFIEIIIYIILLLSLFIYF